MTDYLMGHEMGERERGEYTERSLVHARETNIICKRETIEGHICGNVFMS